MAQLTTVLTTSSIYLSNYQAVNNLVPVTASGGTQPYSWTISPALPANLNFNTNNGHISGQPVTLLDPTPYTVTVKDHVNSSSHKTFNLSVVVPPLLINIPTQAKIGQSFYSAITGGPINGSVVLTNLTTSGTPSTFSLDDSGSRTVTYTLAAPTGSQTIQITIKNSAGTTVNIVTRSVVAYNNLLSAQVLYPNQSLTVNQAIAPYIPVSASGGDGTISRSISPALPTGLSFNTTNGQITGTPTGISAASQYAVTFSDSSGQTVIQDIIIAVIPVPITLSQNLGLSVQTLTAGQAINSFTPVTATGGYGTISWSTSPALPTGLSIDPATGAISGTPTVIGSYTTYNVVATDQAGQSTSLPISISINPARLTIITPIADQVLAVYQPVTLTPVAGGGFNTLTWSVSPSLPNGLSFNTATGEITGTPTTITSTKVYTLTVVDRANQTASQTFSLSTIPLSTLTGIRVKDIILIRNQLMSVTQPIQSYGGYGSKSWAISPALPAGLSFNSATGQITGTPTAISSSITYTVTITDSAATPQTAQNTFTLSVVTALTVSYTVPGVTSQNLNQNESYSFTPVSPTGGLAPYNYTISPNLPAGLTFNANSGLIQGSPTTTSTTFPYTITISDQLNESSSEPFTLGVGGYGTSNQPSGPVTDLITTKTTAAATLYNQLAANLSAIMGTTSTGYGFAGSFINPVYSSTSTINWTDWQKLFYDANLINTHITGNPITLSNGNPVYFNSTSTLRADFVDAIIAATNNGVINQYTAAPSQLRVLPISDSSNNVWDSTIVSSVKIVSQDTATTQYFFNLGGYIQPTLTQGNEGGLTDPTLLSDWQTLFDAANALMIAHPYNRSLYLTGSHHYQTNTNIHGDYISLDYTRVRDVEIDITVTLHVGTTGLNADSASPKYFVVTNTVNTYYSHGALNAITPVTKSIITSFGQGGQSITPTVGVLRASVSNLTYNMHQYDESVRQTITLTNSGNRPVSIFAILMPDNKKKNEPVPNLYQSWDTLDNSKSIIGVQPNSTAYFDVSYVSQNLGVFNNFILILSDADNDNGSVVIKTIQNVKGPVFRPKLGTTSTYNVNVTSYHKLTNQLAIQTTPYVPLASWSTNTSLSSNLPHTNVTWIDPNGTVNDLTNETAIFTIQHLPAGPLISFNPESFATYYRTHIGIDTEATLNTIITATVSVDCIPRGVSGAPADLSHPTTTSTTIVMNLSIPTNQHLGHWLSPTSLDNCIVGMSYDIIGLQPYLTIGVGVDSTLISNGQLADPLPSQIADSSYNLNYANLSTGPDADPEWAHGIPLYKSSYSTWAKDDPITGFLYDYGVWFSPDSSSPNGKLVNRRYLLNIPQDGYYDWHFAAQLVAYFVIDGEVLGDTRKSANSVAALAGYKGSVFLRKGLHILQLAGANLFQPTDTDPLPVSAFALNITQQSTGQSIWSTLTPVRSSTTFAGWSEVYRIPLSSVGTGTPQTYYSGGYVVKDSGAIYGQYEWQSVFGDYTRGSRGAGSLFIINDDGYGNLSIINQFKTILTGDPSTEQTTDQLQYISYYYDTLDFNKPSGQDFENHARRIHNLDTGPQGDGSQCRQFLGFSAGGDVITRLTRYPGYQNYDPIPRYLTGSLNLATTGVPSGSALRNNLLSLASNPALWALGIGYLLWQGGIANYLITQGAFVLGTDTILGSALYETGTFLSSFASFGEAGVLAGQVFSYGAAQIGSMLGSGSIATLGGGAAEAAYAEAILGGASEAVAADAAAAAAAAELGAGTTFLGVVATAMPYIAVAVLVYMYGGQIWHAVTGIVNSVVNFVGDVVSSVVHVFCCFDPEAKVTMADGTKKKIKDVCVGDQVMGMNGKPNRVLGIEKPILGDRQMYKFNDHWAFVSDEHKLLTTEGWQVFNPNSYAVEKSSTETLGKITVGTEMITTSGTELITTVESEARPYDYTIYNLIVEGDHTFIVEDVIAYSRGCIITNAICEYYGGFPEECLEMALMRKLRDDYAIFRKDLIPLLDSYYNNSEKIVDRLAKLDNRRLVYLKIKALLDRSARHILQQQYQEGVNAYVDMILYAAEVAGVDLPEYQEFYQTA